jgi:uncharacterized protein (DUF1786 family)
LTTLVTDEQTAADDIERVRELGVRVIVARRDAVPPPAQTDDEEE